MKIKLFSLMAAVLFMGSSTSAAPYEKPIEEDFGRASDCANYWRNAVMTLAHNNGDDPNTGSAGNMTYLEIYMIAYTNCVNN